MRSNFVKKMIGVLFVAVATFAFAAGEPQDYHLVWKNDWKAAWGHAWNPDWNEVWDDFGPAVLNMPAEAAFGRAGRGISTCGEHDNGQGFELVVDCMD